VYARELDILGFDKFWKYTKKNEKPIMWAEYTNYYYFGKNVAKIKDGNLYTKPELIILEEAEPKGRKLKFINISKKKKKNRDLLSVIEQTTVRKIFDVYKKFEKKLDCFSVAFSGGKDSIVLLELVKKTLPHNAFYVIFGDTQMEFPDTYSVINKIEKQCKKESIVFLRAKSDLEIKESWRVFGPPSRVLRWCCGIHKSAPQTITLRNYLNKDYKGLSFVGVRAEESPARNAYDELSFGEKIKGQYSHNAILEWTSAEIWSYIFANGLLINEAYKKGNGRAGCLLCPTSGGNSDFFRYSSYPQEIQNFVDIIKEKDNRNLGKNYIISNGWGARNNGRDLSDNKLRYFEKFENGFLKIDIIEPESNYKEWIKTIKNLNDNFKVERKPNGYSIYLPEQIAKENPSYTKLFKQVFKKSAYCMSCKVCEANCRNGSISFEKGLSISNCLQCGECHKIDNGCLRFHSLRFSTNGEIKMKSLNSFAGHTAKPEWLRDFFDKKENFFKENSLGPNQFSGFKRFLRDAGIIEKENLTEIAEIICRIGWDTETSLGIMLANLAYNPQFEWFIKNLSVGRIYERKYVEEMLSGLSIDKKSVGMILESFKRICETAFGQNLNFGNVAKNGDIQRTKCRIGDNRVILYSLYKFAENANNYYQFTLARLLNFTIDSNGISPNQIFGITKEEMQTILLNLTTKYSEFINASFTHDLDKISLTENLKSNDVLKLFI
jgi:phosphoadenosine phosphosulfate reductase